LLRLVSGNVSLQYHLRKLKQY